MGQLGEASRGCASSPRGSTPTLEALDAGALASPCGGVEREKSPHQDMVALTWLAFICVLIHAGMGTQNSRAVERILPQELRRGG